MFGILMFKKCKHNKLLLGLGYRKIILFRVINISLSKRYNFFNLMIYKKMITLGLE